MTEIGVYSDDVNTMTEEQLLKALSVLAENWREKPYLSNEAQDGARYHELKDALKDRFDCRMQIYPVEFLTDYQLVSDHWVKSISSEKRIKFSQDKAIAIVGVMGSGKTVSAINLAEISINKFPEIHYFSIVDVKQKTGFDLGNDKLLELKEKNPNTVISHNYNSYTKETIENIPIEKGSFVIFDEPEKIRGSEKFKYFLNWIKKHDLFSCWCMQEFKSFDFEINRLEPKEIALK